ncbi:MAG TPA: AarF/ABC1/UbiB kinase family protein [Anaerolineaceae bacterium]|nr:AarF/ABC1/UbiB kinase family protein [Anaerolineaceae bacterium]HPN50437.1 AarF/ABC1/UbiB kinase family protein [Anaerolineaceae bacterium]
MLFDQEQIRELRQLFKDRLHLRLGEFNDRSLPERLRLMLEELGPTYVKLGQVVSSRTDLLPPDWIAELKKLHDAVPPFPYEQVRQTFIEDLGAPPEILFAEFDPVPVAAASIGQVHRARLLNGQPVVVKVQRPGIHDVINADIEMISRLARLVEARTAIGRKAGLRDIVAEFALSLNEEMDYHNEATNADALRHNLRKAPRIHVPYIHWDKVTTRILTMEAVEGIKIDDMEALKAAGVDLKLLAEDMIKSIFQQLLIDGFFHADPHPGNLFVIPETNTLVFIDLGMTGRLLPEQCEQISKIVRALVDRDSKEIVRLMLLVGVPYQNVDEKALRRAVDRMIGRYLNASLSSISFSQLVSDVLKVVFEHGIRLPGEFSLGVKVLLQAEGIAFQLNPDIQIVDVATMIWRQVALKRLDPRYWLDRGSDDAHEAIRMIDSVSHSSEAILKQIEKGALKVGVDLTDLDMDQIFIITNRMTGSLVLVGMLIGSALAMGVSPNQSWNFIPLLGVIGFIASMALGGSLVWMVFIDLLRGRKRRKKE